MQTIKKAFCIRTGLLSFGMVLVLTGAALAGSGAMKTSGQTITE